MNARTTSAAVILPLPTMRRHTRMLLAVLVALVMPMATAGAQTATSSDVETSARVEPAMVYIETYWTAFVRDHTGMWLNDGMPFEWTSRCSGFIVNPSGYVVTAGHCVDDSLDQGARLTAILYGIDLWVANGWITPEEAPLLAEGAYGNWQVEGAGSGTPPDRQVFVAHGRAASGLATGEAWPARVVEVKSLNEGDVALLKVEQTGLPTLGLAEDTTITVGTEVLSVGYPASTDLVVDQTLEPTFKDGQVSSETTRDGGLLPVYEISAAVSAGMSGGPTVNLDGEVIGVNSFSPVGETQQFNFLSPVSLVAEMLSRNGVSNEPGPIDTLYSDALDAFFAGEYREAMDGFTAVLDRMPSHSQAQEFRAEAAQLADTQPAQPDGDAAAPAAEAEQDGGAPVMLIVVFVLVGLVVVALGTTLAMVLRNRSTPSPTLPGPSAQAQPPPQAPLGTQVGETALTPEPVPPSQPGWTPDGWYEPMVSEPDVGTPFGQTIVLEETDCRDCGTHNPPGSDFCAHCGHPLHRPGQPMPTG